MDPSGRASRVRRWSALALTALVLSAQQPQPATADHGGRPLGTSPTCRREAPPDRCVSVGNDHQHFVFFDASLSEGLASSLRDTMADDYDPTALDMFVQTRITAETDVIAFSIDYGDNGAAGWTNCPADSPQGINSVGDRWCQRQTLHFNLNARFAEFFGDDESRDHVACHELGHTLGMRHWGNPPHSDGPVAATCMNANTPNGPATLHQADVDHINAYPYSVPSPPTPTPISRPTPTGPAAATGPARMPKRIAAACSGSATPLTSKACKIKRFPDAPRTSASAPAASVAAWARAVVDANEVESYRSLAELTRGADAVVRGRVVSVAPGRVFGDVGGEALHYAAATVRVGELLAGRLPPGHSSELTLEIPLFDGPESIGLLQASLPATESIFFLRNKGESARVAGLPARVRDAETAYYRLAFFRALIVNAGGAAATLPGEDDFLASLESLPFDEVASRIRDAAR